MGRRLRLTRLMRCGFALCALRGTAGAQTAQRIVVPPAIKTAYDSARTGLRALGLGGDRDGRLFVPHSYSPAQPAPLILLLHGATQSSAMWFGSFAPLADRAEARHAILLAPDSRGRTWDFARDSSGADMAFINRALAMVCAQYNVDRGRIAIVGFSDGASYALTLGRANGDVAPSVVAFSPGGFLSLPRHGAPAFFVSHGTSDQILPIDRTSRRIVPELRAEGYTVEYREFDGRHEVPPAIADAAMEWLAKRWSAAASKPADQSTLQSAGSAVSPFSGPTSRVPGRWAPSSESLPTAFAAFHGGRPSGQWKW